MGLANKIKETTRVVLWVDNSGSMTTNTVRASYDAFISKLQEFNITNGDRLRILSGSSENWICPHLTTLFADCVGPGCTCAAAESSSLNINIADCDCCCINENFFLSGIVRADGTCPATVYGERVITRPSCSGTGLVRVKITGTVDDELIVNGEIIEPGQYPFTPGCNGAHTIGGGSGVAGGSGYSFVLNASSFTIAAGDNHGGSTSYNLKICFAPI
jgi:hypothetical protein